MKIPIKYVNDEKGNVQAVQITFTDWEKMLNRLRKYEQALHLRSELKEAFEQVEALKNTRTHRQTLDEFLNEISYNSNCIQPS